MPPPPSKDPTPRDPEVEVPSLPSPQTLSKMPRDERLAAASSATTAASSASSLASTLRSKASLLTDPTERNRVLHSAYAAELAAHGNTKKARILTSGTFQGAAGGAGVVHGPWIVLKGLAGGKDGDGEERKIPKEAVEDGSVVFDEGSGEVRAVDEEGLRRARERAEKAERAEREGGGGGEVGGDQGKKEKKRPRKIEVRKKA